LHSLKRLAFSINIIPSSKFRYHPSPSRCIWRKDSCYSFHNSLFLGAHIYHHFGNVEIFLIGNNTNFTYMYIMWNKICVDLGCTSHLWLHQFVDLAFILSDISTMNVVPKLFLPKGRCIPQCSNNLLSCWRSIGPPPSLHWQVIPLSLWLFASIMHNDIHKKFGHKNKSPWSYFLVFTKLE
jgi:hypothetical protein